MDVKKKGIAVLPESTGDLTIGGDLLLGNKKLESLPHSFGSLTAGGHLYVDNNQLGSRPAPAGCPAAVRKVFLPATLRRGLSRVW